VVLHRRRLLLTPHLQVFSFKAGSSSAPFGHRVGRARIQVQNSWRAEERTQSGGRLPLLTCGVAGYPPPPVSRFMNSGGFRSGNCGNGCSLADFFFALPYRRALHPPWHPLLVERKLRRRAIPPFRNGFCGFPLQIRFPASVEVGWCPHRICSTRDFFVILSPPPVIGAFPPTEGVESSIICVPFL